MEKWIGTSRAFWGFAAPALSAFLQSTGYGEELFGSVNSIVEGGLLVAGGVSWLWHYFRPDPRRVRILPAGVRGKLGGLLLVLVVGLGGCAFQITGKGLQGTFGQGQATTCDEQATSETTDQGTDCSTATGGPLSAQGASILAPLFNLLGAVGKVLVSAGGA